MTALDTLRRRAEKAAGAFRDAQQAAEAEAEAIRARNAERTAAFWSDAGARCAAARESADDALRQVRELIAAGELAHALDTYGEYRRHREAWRKLGQHARTATGRWVDHHGNPADPTATDARQVFPEGVPTNSQLAVAPEPWRDVLAKALSEAAVAHADRFVGETLAPLRESLELEPEQ